MTLGSETLGMGGASGELLNSGGMVRSTDAAQAQSFTYNTTYSGAEGVNLSVNVTNTTESRTRPDRWILQITVQNPFDVNPNRIVNSNVRGHED